MLLLAFFIARMVHLGVGGVAGSFRRATWASTLQNGCVFKASPELQSFFDTTALACGWLRAFVWLIIDSPPAFVRWFLLFLVIQDQLVVIIFPPLPLSLHLSALLREILHHLGLPLVVCTCCLLFLLLLLQCLLSLPQSSCHLFLLLVSLLQSQLMILDCLPELLYSLLMLLSILLVAGCLCP